MEASKHIHHHNWIPKELSPAFGAAGVFAPPGQHVSDQQYFHRSFAPTLELSNPTAPRVAQRRDQAALRLAVERKLVKRLVASASIEEIASVVVDELCPALDYSLVAVQAVRGGTLRTLAASGELADRYGEVIAQEWPIELGIRGRVARTARLALVNDTSADSDYVKPIAAQASGSEVAAPILVNGNVWGLLVLEQIVRDAFDWYDLVLTDAIVSLIGAAIRRCELATAVQDSVAMALAALGDVLEAKDPYTADHSEKVTEYAIPVAYELGLDDRQVQNVYYCALLHDIGKIGVASSIINKPSALTNSETRMMRQHAIFGARMLAKIPSLAHIAPLVRAVHERWDGRGYPDGLIGTAIPIESRVVAVCDAWHAMIEDRVYRKALPFPRAIEELRRNSGSQFDPEVVQAFLTVARRSVGDAHRQSTCAA